MLTRLYHGTNARNVDAILRDGIRPRGERNSNWQKAPSRADRVYLTDMYGVYFAAASLREDAREGAVIEIDADALDPELFRPDEDAIAQILQAHGALDDATVHEFAATTSLDGLEYLWAEALAALGNVGYAGVIPPSAIRRVATIRFNRALYDLALRSNHCITIAHRESNAWQRGLTEWALTGQAELLPTDVREDLAASHGKLIAVTAGDSAGGVS